jgi:hypothetical protein
LYARRSEQCCYQLSVAEPVAGGAVKILVAIANVDALVKKDSAIDGHAWTTPETMESLLVAARSWRYRGEGRGNRAAMA